MTFHGVKKLNSRHHSEVTFSSKDAVYLKNCQLMYLWEPIHFVGVTRLLSYPVCNCGIIPSRTPRGMGLTIMNFATMEVHTLTICENAPEI